MATQEEWQEKVLEVLEDIAANVNAIRDDIVRIQIDASGANEYLGNIDDRLQQMEQKVERSIKNTSGEV